MKKLFAIVMASTAILLSSNIMAAEGGDYAIYVTNMTDTNATLFKGNLTATPLQLTTTTISPGVTMLPVGSGSKKDGKALLQLCMSFDDNDRTPTNTPCVTIKMNTTGIIVSGLDRKVIANGQIYRAVAKITDGAGSFIFEVS